MTRGYLLRILLWAVVVVGLLALVIFAFTRDLPTAGLSTATAHIAPAAWQRPILWLETNLFFLGVIAFLVLSAQGLAGRGLGVEELIHDDHRGVRFLNGLVYGMTIGNAVFVAYVTSLSICPWEVQTTPTLYPVPASWGRTGEADEIHRTGHFLLFVWLPILFLTGVGRPRGTPWFSLGLAGSVPLSAALLLGVWRLLTWEMLSNWRDLFASTPGAREGRIPTDAYPMHAAATGFMLLPMVLILLLAIRKWLGKSSSPVWVVCLTLWVINSTYGFITFHYWGWQFLLLVGVVLILLVANIGHPYKLMLPGLEPEYAKARAGKPIVMGVTESPVGRKPVPLIQAEDFLSTFAKQHATKPKLIVLCTSGGGIRAALWTAAVMAELERVLGPKFRDHLRLITGASGGMVQAALHAGQCVRPMRSDLSDIDVLAADSLWPTWQELFFRDWPGALLPFHREKDRGFTLERSWQRNSPGANGNASPLAVTFAELHEAEKAGHAPACIFSPFLVEDGRRILISNLDLADLTIDTCPTLALDGDGRATWKRTRISQPAVEFFRLFPDAHRRIAVSTAARLSASFPYVSPVVYLPTTPARRVVDAGYFDNYGINVAGAWLLQHQELVKQHCSGVAILEVRAFPLEETKTGLPTNLLRPTSLMGTILAGLSTPAEALGIVQSAGAYYRNDQLLGQLDVVFNGAEPGYLVRAPFECAGDGALSWAVNSLTRDTIVKQVEAIRPTTEALRQWMG
jgi:Patatin-like phospholipase